MIETPNPSRSLTADWVGAKMEEPSTISTSINPYAAGG